MEALEKISAREIATSPFALLGALAHPLLAMTTKTPLVIASEARQSRFSGLFQDPQWRDKMTNENALQDKLDQLRDAVKQRWGVLTDKDLATINGKLDQL